MNLNNIFKLFTEEVLNEKKKKKNSFKILQNNKIPLTKEERAKVIKAKAVWHPSNHPNPVSAVWKGKDSNGKLWYVTHTHRAYNKTPTLKGTINRFHKFIKSTA